MHTRIYSTISKISCSTIHMFINTTLCSLYPGVDADTLSSIKNLWQLLKKRFKNENVWINVYQFLWVSHSTLEWSWFINCWRILSITQYNHCFYCVNGQNQWEKLYITKIKNKNCILFLFDKDCIVRLMFSFWTTNHAYLNFYYWSAHNRTLKNKEFVGPVVLNPLLIYTVMR